MIRIGRRSELSACIVVQSVFLSSVFVMVVMSGEVGCWFAWGGTVGSGLVCLCLV